MATLRPARAAKPKWRMATPLHDMTQESTAPAEANRLIRLGTRRTDPVLLALVIIDLLLFLGGVTKYSGIPITLGFGTRVEPVVVPAAIVEGIGAVGLTLTVGSIASRADWADRLAWWVLVLLRCGYCGAWHACRWRPFPRRARSRTTSSTLA
jgi:hypothetical protein